ncbi:hypothetical protein LXL04_008401 [Taraxacum kok-saghyz]
MVPTLSLICVSQTLNFVPVRKNLNFGFHSFKSSMVMGEGKKQSYSHQNQRWNVMEESDKFKHQQEDDHDHDHEHEHEQPCSSIEEACSTISNGSSLTCSSSSSSDTTDDASSSSANSSRSSLYDLSDLMSQLPIKRGLSKFYHGKSDSFTSLARVTSIEDLPKKEPKMKKTKKKKSHRSHTLPRPIIAKKNHRCNSNKKFGGSMKKEQVHDK